MCGDSIKRASEHSFSSASYDIWPKQSSQVRVLSLRMSTSGKPHKAVLDKHSSSRLPWACVELASVLHACGRRTPARPSHSVTLASVAAATSVDIWESAGLQAQVCVDPKLEPLLGSKFSPLLKPPRVKRWRYSGCDLGFRPQIAPRKKVIGGVRV